VKSFFDLYLENGQLIYAKYPCVKNDIKNLFYLHVYPVTNSGNTEPLVTYFPFQGIEKNGKCVFTHALPNFQIQQINTGQFSNDFNEVDKKPYTIYWKSSLKVN
jgi:hypothetical protein